MVLEYRFEYGSNNNFYESYLKNILNSTSLEYKLLKKEEDILLYVKSEEQELIEFSQDLSAKLPMSIFLKKYHVNVVEEIPECENIESKELKKISYCANCYELSQDISSKNYFNPFISCDICGNTHQTNELIFSEKPKLLEYENYKTLFEDLAYKISEGKKVKIKTSRGSYIFSKEIDIDKNNKLLCCNMDNIYKLISGEKEKSVLLQSVEKPLIEFDINAVYMHQEKIHNTKVELLYPYELLLKLLSDELKNYQIDFLSIEEPDNQYDAKLTYINLESENSIPKVTNCFDKVFILENGIYDKRFDEIDNMFKEKAKSQFMVLREENSIQDKTILNIFTSTKYDDNICVYSKKVDGLIDILNYQLPKNIKTLYKNIAKDKNGKKLIENYKAKFPNEYLDGFMFDISTLKQNSIFSLWKLASKILGIEDIYEEAINEYSIKGPRIDYQTSQKSENSSLREFDVEKFIQSGMSFKLAGLDNKTLSVGYLESFTDFLSNFADELDTKFELDGISFCGDMISKELFYSKVNKSLSKNYKIYYNKDFPIQ